MSEPIYIVSKGRADTRLTNRHLAALGIDHRIVVEEQEADVYRRNCERAEILILPPEYKQRYEVCDEYGLTKSTGSGPARNFAWDHATAAGAARHWVLDDNIDGFFRYNHNLKTPCKSRAFFRAMEDFCDRYANVAMAGPNYFMFCSRKNGNIPAYVPNTRIYSCILLRNDIPFRWRARYNEDTDLSLRILKAGYATVLFNAFLQYKMPTQTVAGGNTSELYAKDGTKPKSEMLERLHPDVARVTWKFDRWHHEVDYSQWRTRPLELKPGVVVPEGVNNYGMVLKQRQANGTWVRIDKPRSERKSKYAPGQEAQA